MKVSEIIVIDEDRVKLVKLALKRSKWKKPPQPKNIVIAANPDEADGYDTAVAAQ